ncbi:M10 family metallopeptidase C-terminal domain-containing protein [Ramlibacter albus]|uniref:M10 family metallopeptidase C-terminal domain-containing protein n=1 Tax=Ramlibacter albus TaxID=2079448 RepID=A0A923MC21_9BURK|nr:M10 family metallopeptidase C-terminal domain-containing protein [Ramlibacter albus]MBC5767910.1 M10 family metallopeptidase C-terminal domain-containing protein [Ramlibacter albus]
MSSAYVCMCPMCAGPLAGSKPTDLPPAPAAAVVATSITGDYRVDCLLENAQLRWNATAAMGTSVEVTYSFMTAKPTYGGTDSGGDVGFRAYTTQQMEAVRGIFTRLATETGLRFREVADSATSYGQIRFGNNTQTVSAGYAYMPNSTGDDLSGDVWTDDSDPTNLTNVGAGTYAYSTLVHEIGHALGLKHPGNYNAGEASRATTAGNFLGAAEDSTVYTIMSYRDNSNGVQRDWFGSYDLLALRALYGAGTGNSGDTRFSFDSTAATRLATIYDSGGTDTLDVSASGAASTVDMRPGGFSTVGGTTANNVSIDLSTTVENFVGSASNDTVTGNTANNRFTLGAGTNRADGGAGTDVAVYGSARAGYQVANSNGTLTVSGNGATDTLSNIERLEFSDRRLAFDVKSQQVAKVLGAVFGPSTIPQFEGIGLQLMDGGMSYETLMGAALQFRLGANATNEAVVGLLLQNLLGFEMPAAVIANFTPFITSGQYTQATFGILAADHPLNTNNINLVGIIANGVSYT